MSCNHLTLGMLLVHHLQVSHMTSGHMTKCHMIGQQVLQLLDLIRQAPKQTMNDLESECLPALHMLFSMTLVPIGGCGLYLVSTWV